MGDVLIVAEHLGGALADVTFEALAVGRQLAASLGGTCVVGLVGGSDAMVGELGAASRVVRVAGGEHYEPEAWVAGIGAIVAATSPTVILLGHTSIGMDLAGALSVGLGMPLASSCSGVSGDDGIVAMSTMYGGKMNASIELGHGPCIVSLLAGAAAAADGRAAGTPAVQALPAPATAGRVRFKGRIAPEAADVDITASDVLVAIGRGIGDKDGVEVAQELADALDAVVAASRPIIDAGWLPRSRQVGKSGLKVTPKVYLALGISGAPEHLEGIKGASTVIAVNTDPNAPIFRIAEYGLVADLYEVCEALTEMAE